LLRCYISRVENGHTVPAVATLEKMARALEVPVYQLFHDGAVAPSIRKLKHPKNSDAWGSTGSDADFLSKLCRLLAKMDPADQSLLLHLAQKVSKAKSCSWQLDCSLGLPLRLRWISPIEASPLTSVCGLGFG
jgi:transcriptional regulator with XRE-family HTH domain